MPTTPIVHEIRQGTKHIYTLQPGDDWRLFKNYIVIANPAHPPFMIDLFTGERKELSLDAQALRSPIE